MNIPDFIRLKYLLLISTYGVMTTSWILGLNSLRALFGLFFSKRNEYNLNKKNKYEFYNDGNQLVEINYLK